MVWRCAKTGKIIYLRSAEVSDKPIVKDFLDALSVQSLYRRFFSLQKNFRNEFMGSFFAFKNNEIKLLAIPMNSHNSRSIIIAAIGEIFIDINSYWGEIALLVRDDHQNRGIGRELLTYIIELASKLGLKGLEGIVQIDNGPMLHLCESVGFPNVEKKFKRGVYELKMSLPLMPIIHKALIPFWTGGPHRDIWKMVGASNPGSPKPSRGSSRLALAWMLTNLKPVKSHSYSQGFFTPLSFQHLAPYGTAVFWDAEMEYSTVKVGRY